MKPDTRFNARPEIRAQTNADGTITFEGYAIVFNSESCDLGGFCEMVAPTALDRCMSDGKADIRCLQNHDASRVLGRNTAGSATFTVDAKGLRFVTRSQPTSYARDLALTVNAKEVSGCSFRMYVAEGGDKWLSTPDGRMIRTLHDIEIDEVSIVTFPAYEATEVSTRSAERRDEARRNQAAPPPSPPAADLATLEASRRRRALQIAAVSL